MIRIDNTDDSYVEHVNALVDALHCPECGAPATHTAFSLYQGTYFARPIHGCSTEGCSYHYADGPDTWTPALNA